MALTFGSPLLAPEILSKLRGIMWIVLRIKLVALGGHLLVGAITTTLQQKAPKREWSARNSPSQSAVAPKADRSTGSDLPKPDCQNFLTPFGMPRESLRT